MKKKVAYLEGPEVASICNTLAEIPIKYMNQIAPVLQLLQARAKMLVEVDLPDSEPPEKPKRGRAKK